MRVSRVVSSFALLLALSACAGTDNNFARWMNSEPSTFDKHVGVLPRGYTGQNKHNLTEVTSSDGAVTTYVEAQPATTTETVLLDDATMTTSSGYGRLADEIYFLHGSSRLTNSEKNSIHALADTTKASAAPVGVTVIGHASQRVDGVIDPMRKEEINYEMARKRADNVSRELGNAGLNPAWIQSISKGDSEPNANTGGKSQEAADRRVEIYMNENR